MFRAITPAALSLNRRRAALPSSAYPQLAPEAAAIAELVATDSRLVVTGFGANREMKTTSTRRYVRYADQVLCDRFAGPGDSGSIVLNERNEVVVLCAAGSPSKATFNKIEHVFAALGITLP